MRQVGDKKSFVGVSIVLVLFAICAAWMIFSVSLASEELTEATDPTEVQDTPEVTTPDPEPEVSAPNKEITMTVDVVGGNDDFLSGTCYYQRGEQAVDLDFTRHMELTIPATADGKAWYETEKDDESFSFTIKNTLDTSNEDQIRYYHGCVYRIPGCTFKEDPISETEITENLSIKITLEEDPTASFKIHGKFTDSTFSESYVNYYNTKGEFIESARVDHQGEFVIGQANPLKAADSMGFLILQKEGYTDFFRAVTLFDHEASGFQSQINIDNIPVKTVFGINRTISSDSERHDHFTMDLSSGTSHVKGNTDKFKIPFVELNDDGNDYLTDGIISTLDGNYAVNNNGQLCHVFYLGTYQISYVYTAYTTDGYIVDHWIVNGQTLYPGDGKSVIVGENGKLDAQPVYDLPPSTEEYISAQTGDNTLNPIIPLAILAIAGLAALRLRRRDSV